MVSTTPTNDNRDLKIAALRQTANLMQELYLCNKIKMMNRELFKPYHLIEE